MSNKNKKQKNILGHKQSDYAGTNTDKYGDPKPSKYQDNPIQNDEAQNMGAPADQRSGCCVGDITQITRSLQYTLASFLANLHALYLVKNKGDGCTRNTGAFRDFLAGDSTFSHHWPGQLPH